jgi:hypothetical protein
VTDALAFAVAALSALSALGVVVATVGGRFRRHAVGPLLVALESGLVVQAVLDVLAQLRGHVPGERAVHLAYLVVSLVLLPLAAYETRRDDSVWSAAVVVIALVVLVVLVIRMQTTWR